MCRSLLSLIPQNTLKQAIFTIFLPHRQREHRRAFSAYKSQCEKCNRGGAAGGNAHCGGSSSSSEDFFSAEEEEEDDFTSAEQSNEQSNEQSTDATMGRVDAQAQREVEDKARMAAEETELYYILLYLLNVLVLVPQLHMCDERINLVPLLTPKYSADSFHWKPCDPECDSCNTYRQQFSSLKRPSFPKPSLCKCKQCWLLHGPNNETLLYNLRWRDETKALSESVGGCKSS